MKKFLVSLIAIFILVKLVWIGFVNSAVEITFLFCPFLDKVITLNFPTLILGLFVSGIIFACCINALKNKGKNLNAYKNQYEKIAVANEEQSDKVKILEEKIKSLEIALSKALEK